MKKLILILMLLVLVGCDQDALTFYQDAVEKTETITRAKTELDLSLEMQFSEKALELEPELNNNLGNIRYSSHGEYDKKLNNKIVRQYVGLPGIGVDVIYYNHAGEEFFKIPFAGKYLMLEDLFDFGDEFTFEEPPLSMNTFEEINNRWKALVREEDVVNLGDDLIDTPEGEVKVKKMVVSFSNEQIKNFLSDVIDLVSKDTVFIDQLSSYPMYTVVDGKPDAMPLEDFTSDMLIENVRDLLDKMVVDNFELIIYIDVDQYIIESSYEIKVSFTGEIGEYLEGISFTSAYQLFDLHEKIEFEFPEITEENTTTVDTILDELNIDIQLN